MFRCERAPSLRKLLRKDTLPKSRPAGLRLESHCRPGLPWMGCRGFAPQILPISESRMTVGSGRGRATKRGESEKIVLRMRAFVSQPRVIPRALAKTPMAWTRTF